MAAEGSAYERLTARFSADTLAAIDAAVAAAPPLTPATKARLTVLFEPGRQLVTERVRARAVEMGLHDADAA